MMLYKIILFISLQSLLTCSSIKIEQQKHCKGEVDTITNQFVYSYVDQMPKYPGGKVAIVRFFINHYDYPQDNESFQTSFKLEFIINKQGDIIAPRIKGKDEHELTEADKEALKVLNEMPKWIPGKCHGKIVPVKTFLPLIF